MRPFTISTTFSSVAVLPRHLPRHPPSSACPPSLPPFSPPSGSTSRSSSTSFSLFPPPYLSTSLPSNHIASSVAVMLEPSRARGIDREPRCSRAARGLTRACAIVLQWAMQAETHGVVRKDGGPAAEAAGMAGRTAMIGQRVAGESGDKTGTRLRRTPNGAMALPPQQRRWSRLNGRLASPRLAS